MKSSLLALLALLCLSGCVTRKHYVLQQGDATTICHKGKKTLTLPADAVEGHMSHGDWYGPCLTQTRTPPLGHIPNRRY